VLVEATRVLRTSSWYVTGWYWIESRRSIAGNCNCIKGRVGLFETVDVENRLPESRRSWRAVVCHLLLIVASNIQQENGACLNV
jgi:hypothetical protein